MRAARERGLTLIELSVAGGLALMVLAIAR